MRLPAERLRRRSISPSTGGCSRAHRSCGSRWKRAVIETNDALGEAVGKLYVAHYFPPAEKARAQGLARNLVAAFATRIDRLAWMSPATREKAKAKLATLKVGRRLPGSLA